MLVPGGHFFGYLCTAYGTLDSVRIYAFLSEIGPRFLVFARIFQELEPAALTAEMIFLVSM